MPTPWNGRVVHHLELLSWADSFRQGTYWCYCWRFILCSQYRGSSGIDCKDGPRNGRVVHHLEEVDMLTTKIDLLMKKLEDPSLNNLKMVNAHMTCEETGHMCVNWPTVHQDVNFIGNFNNGFCPNQGFTSGWNNPNFPIDNCQRGGNG
jgi:hypothetical protein